MRRLPGRERNAAGRPSGRGRAGAAAGAGPGRTRPRGPNSRARGGRRSRPRAAFSSGDRRSSSANPPLPPDVVQVHESDGAFAALALKILTATLEPAHAAGGAASGQLLASAVRSIRFEVDCSGAPGQGGASLSLAFKAPLASGLPDSLARRPARPGSERGHRQRAAPRLRRVRGFRAAQRHRSGGARSEVSADRERSTALFRAGAQGPRSGVSRLGRQSPEARLPMIAGDGEHRPRLERLVRELRPERARAVPRPDAARGSQRG